MIDQVASAVREARREHGWSQIELAARSGVSRATVARIESGTDVSTGPLVRVARALGLTLDLRPDNSVPARASDQPKVGAAIRFTSIERHDKLFPLADLREAAGNPGLTAEQAIAYLLDPGKSPSSFQSWFMKVAPNALRHRAERSAVVDGD